MKTQILKALSTGAKTLPAICAGIDADPVSVRAELVDMQRAGLVSRIMSPLPRGSFYSHVQAFAVSEKLRALVPQLLELVQMVAAGNTEIDVLETRAQELLERIGR